MDTDGPTTPDSATLREAAGHVEQLASLGDLAVAAEELTRLLGVGGEALLDHDGRLAIDQARSNAHAIVSSLERLG